MQRRQFIQRLAGATAIALAAGITTVTIDGCSFNIEGALNTILNAALAILKVAEPGASWTGDLANAIAALQQAETQWKAGSPSTVVVDALNTVEAVLAVIPATAAFSPLIDILVTSIEAVISAFGLTAMLSPMSSERRRTIVNSPHYNAVALNRPSLLHPTWTGAVKAQWNEKARQIGLPQAQIK